MGSPGVRVESRNRNEGRVTSDLSRDDPSQNVQSTESEFLGNRAIQEKVCDQVAGPWK